MEHLEWEVGRENVCGEDEGGGGIVFFGRGRCVQIRGGEGSEVLYPKLVVNEGVILTMLPHERESPSVGREAVYQRVWWRSMLRHDMTTHAINRLVGRATSSVPPPTLPYPRAPSTSETPLPRSPSGRRVVVYGVSVREGYAFLDTCRGGGSREIQGHA